MLEFTSAQIVVTTVAVVGIPALYFLAGWLLAKHRGICPSCHRRALRCVQWIRATIVVNGQRAPDSWSFFLCESCGARWKRHLGRGLESPSEDEWVQYCLEEKIGHDAS